MTPSERQRLRAARFCVGAAALASVFAASACSTGTPQGAIRLLTGEETDTLTAAPAPVALRIDAVVDGGEAALATATLPATTIDLGTLSESTAAALRVTGIDASGRTVVFGQSLTVQYGALDGLTVPLFIQRTGAMARMPLPAGDARPFPLLGVLGGRYLVTTGGTDPALASSLLLYDFAQCASITPSASLASAPQSMALSGTTALLLDGVGGGAVLDLASSATSPATAPAGGSFGDVTGGATVVAPDGSQFVVGATRTTGEASASVLRVDATGTQSWIALSAPRWGASATYSPGLGLVVAGGSAAAPGVEIVAVSQLSGRALSQFAPDPTIGGAAASLDGAHTLLLAGGLAPDGSDPGVRVLDLSCESACDAIAWVHLPQPLVNCAIFPETSGGASLVGSELFAHTTHVLALRPGGILEIATKAAHRGARAVASPVGAPGGFLLFGGANELESFAP